MSLLKCIKNLRVVNNSVLPRCTCSSKLTTFLKCSFSTFQHTQTKILSDKVNVNDSGDTFGTLPKALEHSKNFKSNKLKDNTRVIKVKRTPKNTDIADTFGSLSEKESLWYPEIDEKCKEDNEHSDDSEMVRNISKSYRKPEVYLERMKNLVAEKKLKDALDLFVEMRRNYVKPERHHYTYMIGACSRLGYTEMAFKLFKQVTDRGWKPSPAILTGLFNSCGECPFPEYGLRKARQLKEKIVMKNWSLNQINYNSMIKAFGRCGDLQTAFQIVDEMQKEKIKIDATTYSFLFMSCIADKEAGFTHAIEVWRKMKQRKCLPVLQSYNLLLRAVRDCNVGPDEISTLLLEHWSNFSHRPYGFKIKDPTPKKEILQLEGTKPLIEDAGPQLQIRIEDAASSGDVESSAAKDAKRSVVNKQDEASAVYERVEVPSVLRDRPVKGAEVLDLKSIKTASDRLSLIGGAKGILADMYNHQVTPNVKTFTLLLECLPPNTEDEEALISLMESHNLKPDIGFFNVLIKRRNVRFDYPAAKRVLLLINKWSLSPDLITYGVLSMGCRNYDQAYNFLADMKKLGYSLNTEIMGALLSTACVKANFDYMKDTLLLMDEYQIQPNERMLTRLEDSLEKIRKNIIDMEHGKTVPRLYTKAGFSEEFNSFKKFYEDWLKKAAFAKEEHVWCQFRTEIVDKAKDTIRRSF